VNDNTIDQKVLDDLKAQYGEIYQVETEDGDPLVFRLPSRVEYRRFKSHSLDEQKRAEADEQLVRTVTVYPDAAGVADLFARLPAFATSTAGAILRASGAVQGLEAKKL